MARYLDETQLKTNLRLGKSVEQWLSSVEKDDYTIIKWLTIEKEKNEDYSVVYSESYDDGNEDFIDVYEFSSVDPDEPEGLITTFSSMNDALDFAITNYGASVGKFVSAGMIQDEYANYLESKK